MTDANSYSRYCELVILFNNVGFYFNVFRFNHSSTPCKKAQVEFAGQFYILSFVHPSMKSIHWWGLSDRMICLKNGGLLDKNFNPKPVYTRLHKLIKEDG